MLGISTGRMLSGSENKYETVLRLCSNPITASGGLKESGDPYFFLIQASPPQFIAGNVDRFHAF